MSARNRFPTYCTTCQQDAPAGHGRVFRLAGGWACDCRPARFAEDDGYGEPCDAVRDGYLERYGAGARGRRFRR